MEPKKLLFIGLLLLLWGCGDETIDQEPQQDCAMDKAIKAKASAKAAIVGKWEWMETTYTPRGADKDTDTENPLTANKTLIFEFKGDTLNTYENGALTEKLVYEIRYWGEGSNTIDGQLVIRFTHAMTGEHTETSILFLSSASKCLRLVNSYDDAGGDMLFKRKD